MGAFGVAEEEEVNTPTQLGYLVEDESLGESNESGKSFTSALLAN